MSMGDIISDFSIQKQSNHLNVSFFIYFENEGFYLNKHLIIINFYPAGIYMLKVNNRNTRTVCEICSKLTLKIPERHHWRCSGIFMVNFEKISHLVLVFLLLILKM